MIRLCALDKPLADIDLVDGKMVFSNFLDKNTEKGVLKDIEFIRRGRSDSELFHALPEIYDGQVWAEHVNPDDEPGPDDEIVEPPAD